MILLVLANRALCRGQGSVTPGSARLRDITLFKADSLFVDAAAGDVYTVQVNTACGSFILCSARFYSERLYRNIVTH